MDSIYKKLTDVENRLSLTEEYVRGLRMSVSQLAKLYGSIERIQLQDIDSIFIKDDMRDSVNLKLKRKMLAKRANACLDGLEKLAAGKPDWLRTPMGYDGGMYIANGMATISLHGNDKLEITLPARALAVAPDALTTAVADFFVTSQQGLVNDGFINDYCRTCKCSVPLLPITAFYGHTSYSFGDSENSVELLFVHSHDAAVQILLEDAKNYDKTHLLCTCTGKSSLYISVVRISDEGVMMGSASYSDTIQMKGEAWDGWEKFSILVACYPWHVVAESGTTVTPMQVDCIWVAEEGTELSKVSSQTMMRFKEHVMTATETVDGHFLEHKHDRNIITAHLLASTFSTQGRSLMSERTCSPTSLVVLNVLSDVKEAVTKSNPLATYFAMKNTIPCTGVYELAHCCIGVVTTSINSNDNSSTIMPFIFPAHTLGSAVVKELSLTYSSFTQKQSSFQLLLGIRCDASIIAINKIDQRHTLCINFAEPTHEPPRKCRIRITYTTKREILVCVSLPNDYQNWSTEILLTNCSRLQHIHFDHCSHGNQEKENKDNVHHAYLEALWCEESSAIFKKMGDESMESYAMSRRSDDLRRAYVHYTIAIAYDPLNAVLWSNRSACGMHLSGFFVKGALYDASKATQVKPEWAKGWIREGDALFYLGSFEEAITSYKRALERDPTSIGVNEKLLSALERREAKYLLRAKKEEERNMQEFVVMEEENEKRDNCACM